MTQRHFDVVVLGRSLGALTAAALLARRDFTVLLLGQGQRAASYRFGERTLMRRASTMLAGTTPMWRRVVAELAETQTWKRRAEPLSPMLQVLAPGRRIDLPPDLGLLLSEIEREAPNIAHAVREVYADLAGVNSAADFAFDRDLVCPPGTFWERRETARAMALLPYVRAEPDADIFRDLPVNEAFRQAALASVLFATDLSSLPPPFAVARLHGLWTRGPVALAGGEDDVASLLLDRIAAHGGRIALSGRVKSLHLKRGSLAGVVLDGDDQPTGASFVVSDSDGEGLAALSRGEGIHKRAQREWPRITSTVGRFVTTLRVRRGGVPSPLGREVLVVSKGAFPPLRLQRLDAADTPDEVLLVAEMLLPDRGSVSLREARQTVLDVVRRELPYVERHLVLVDSVHDGLPLWSFENGEKRLVERIELSDAAREIEPMERCLEVDPPGYLGLAGEPIRGPLGRSYLVGGTVLPALGQEGRLLAAWGAARLITRTDRRKERMRKALWTKLDMS